MRVAIDVPNLLYAFYTAALMGAEPSPERRAAAVAQAHRGLLSRVLDLGELNARSVLVFDGDPHPLKRELLEAREAAREGSAASRLTHEDYGPAWALAEALGMPAVRAPHDAEAQAGVMARAGFVDVVATTDWDALVAGAPVLLRNLSAPPGGNGKGRVWEIILLEQALEELGLLGTVPAVAVLDGRPAVEVEEARRGLAAAAVLMGCDFFPGIPGVGPKKALAAVLKARSEGEAPETAFSGRIQGISEMTRALDAYRLLVNRYPAKTAALAWRRPDLSRHHGLLEGLGVKETPELRARVARLSLLHDPLTTTAPVAPSGG